MIKRNQYNTTILEFSQIMKDSKNISSLPLPKFIRKYLADRLIRSVNSEDSKIAKETALNDDYYKTKLYIKILLNESLHRSLTIMETPEGRALFKKLYKKEYSKPKLKLIDIRIKRLRVQYELFNSENNSEEDEEFNFDKYIAKLEMILNVSIWDKMLYQLPYYEELCISKIESND